MRFEAILAFQCIFEFMLNVHCSVFEEVFAWKQLEYANLPADKVVIPDYYNVNSSVPFGMARYQNRLFITCQRRKVGVPAALSVIDLNSVAGQKSPKVQGYPSYAMNDITDLTRPKEQRIVSINRPAIDTCGRLWFVDTGVLNYSPDRVILQPASIWVIDLATDTVVRRTEIPTSMIANGNGLASLTIDVNTCEDTHAYINDVSTYSLIVFSLKQNTVWRFLHNYFSFDPLQGNFNIDGIKFTWHDGIFSVALGSLQPNGYRKAYFHASPSIYEFEVSTEFLKNQSLSLRTYPYDDNYKLYGVFEKNHQSGSHVIDEISGAVFVNHFQLYGVGCYNINDKHRSHIRSSIIDRNETTMIYPSHLNIDSERNLWMLSNRIPRFFYGTLDPNEYNFRIWRAPVVTAIKAGKCSAPKKVLSALIDT